MNVTVPGCCGQVWGPWPRCVGWGPGWPGPCWPVPWWQANPSWQDQVKWWGAGNGLVQWRNAYGTLVQWKNAANCIVWFGRVTRPPVIPPPTFNAQAAGAGFPP
jgi:hypothetical protein